MSHIVLDLCGGTGSWSAPYREAGYDVRLVTLPDHDVREYEPPERVHGILAAPPCTEFAASGARWWATKPPELLAEAVEIVRACLRIVDETQPVWWALENPIGRMRRLVPEVGPVRLTFDPCDYGDPWTKRTQLFGRFNLPVASPVEPERVCSQGSWLQRLGGRSERTKRLRSMTPPGFARAFFEVNP